jgi:hypothetical protein
MKNILRVLAVGGILLFTSVSSFADGNPLPICKNGVCTGAVGSLPS